MRRRTGSQPSDTVEERLLARGPEACLTPERGRRITNMMGRQMAQGALFCGFRLDEHVPADHLLRRINGLLDFGFVREAMAASYSVSGRPSIDPELMLTRETATQREEFLAARRPPPAAISPTRSRIATPSALPRSWSGISISRSVTFSRRVCRSTAPISSRTRPRADLPALTNGFSASRSSPRCADPTDERQPFRLARRPGAALQTGDDPVLRHCREQRAPAACCSRSDG